LKRHCLIPILAALATITCLPNTASAIPAFQRKTGVACNGCHYGATNKLTKLGWEFLNRGHRMAGEKATPPEDLSTQNFLQYAGLSLGGNFTSKQKSPSSFATSSIGLLAGGPVVANLSFYANSTIYSSSGGTSNLSEAEVRYVSDIDKPDYWWVRAGNLEPQVLWLAKSGPTGTAAAASRQLGLGNTFSATSATNYKGLSAGIGSKSGTMAEIGLVNGLGNTSPANNEKDQFATISHSLDANNDMVGLYAYNGKFTYAATGSGATAVPAWKDKYNRFGLLAQFMRPMYAIHGAYFTGKNDVETGGSRHPKGWYAEADYNPQPNGTAFLRYDHETDDIPDNLVTAKTVKGASNFNVGYVFRYHDFSRFGVTFSNLKNEGPGGSHLNQVVGSWSIYL
jgi:hypothetical protein